MITTLKVSGVSKVYRTRSTGAKIEALTDISFELPKGKTLGIVGESGCGKSTLSRIISGLEAPTSGSVEFGGKSSEASKIVSLRSRWKPVQLVFQDPYSSLNPRQTIFEALSEVIRVHKFAKNSQEITERTNSLLGLVGMASDLSHRYPHQLSGGQRQRVSIARSLSAQPSLLVLDEPVSALDVSVRAEVMNLLVDLRGELGLTYIFVSHDLSMIRHISDYIAVMYLGKIIEYGTWQEVLEDPRHPYTQALIKAMPIPMAGNRTLITSRILHGEVPDPANLPTGCSFHSRCPHAIDSCLAATPPLIQIGEGRKVACPVINPGGNLQR